MKVGIKESVVSPGHGEAGPLGAHGDIVLLSVRPLFSRTSFCRHFNRSSHLLTNSSFFSSCCSSFPAPSRLPDDNRLTASISPITRINHFSSSIGLIDRSVALLSASSSWLFSGPALPASYRRDQTALQPLALTDSCLDQPVCPSSRFTSIAASQRLCQKSTFWAEEGNEHIPLRRSPRWLHCGEGGVTVKTKTKE